MKIQFKTTVATFVGLLFVLLSCKKQSISDESRPVVLASPAGSISALQAENKIRQWLKDQQPVTDAAKTEKIRLLEGKLDFSGMRSERLHADKQLVVVPIRSGLSTLSENAGQNVLLIQQDGSGNVRSGHIVQYTAGGVSAETDARSIFAMYHPKEQSTDANYSFLTITGHPFRKLTYKGGQIQSYSALQKNTAGTGHRIPQDPISPATICTDWYWVTTYYYADGHTESTSRFAYRTCETTSGGSPTPDCGAVNDELEGYPTSENGSQSTTLQTSKSRVKLYGWTFYKQAFGMWRFDSYEEGTHVFVNNEWVWKSLIHKSAVKIGWTVGGVVNATVISAIPSVAKYWAGMELTYSISLSAVCQGSPLSTAATYKTGSPRWNVNS